MTTQNVCKMDDDSNKERLRTWSWKDKLKKSPRATKRL